MKMAENSYKMILTSLLVSFIIISAFFTILPHVSGASDLLCDDCCESGYTEYYRCEEENVERLYQYSNCRREWRVKEFCDYGCKNGECLECSTEFTEVEVFPVSDMFEDSTMKSTVEIHNDAESGRTYYLDVQLCRSVEDSVTSCNNIDMEKESVYVGSGSTKYVDVSEYIGTPGYYKIKVSFSTDASKSPSVKDKCGRDAYSNVFKVLADHELESSLDGDIYTGEFRCFGKYRQQRYSKMVNGEYEWRWKIVDYCEHGCTIDGCVGENSYSGGEPEIFIQSEYVIEDCGVSNLPFSIVNHGETDTFDVVIEGEAADWIEISPTVSIPGGGTKSMIAYVSMPCDMPSGDYSFTIRVEGYTDDVYAGTLSFEKNSGIFSVGLKSITYMAVVFIVVFAFFKFYGDRIMPLKIGDLGREEEESF